MESKYKKYEPIFGSWYITGFLGRGSFGEVYEITREEYGIKIKSALKIISIPQDENDIKRRMLEGTDLGSISEYYEDILKSIVSENDIMSRLRGRTNIVSYEDHQIIQHEDGIGYDILIRMELLTPLIDHMLENGMKEEDVVDLGIDICKAIELIHSRKIIHRDIKPQNIFVSDDGDYKLGDFGIARTLEKTTGSLSAKGTYNYMAPEVFKGDKYDKTVDIYSLGLVMYSLLNGNRGPFLPPAPEKTTYRDEEEARNRRLSGEELPQPSFASDMLSYIISKACAADSDDRYRDAGQLRRDLERYRDNYSLHNVAIEPADAAEDALDETVYDASEDVEETVYDEVSMEEAAYDDEKTELDEANVDTVTLLSNFDCISDEIDVVEKDSFITSEEERRITGEHDTSSAAPIEKNRKKMLIGITATVFVVFCIILISFGTSPDPTNNTVTEQTESATTSESEMIEFDDGVFGVTEKDIDLFTDGSAYYSGHLYYMGYYDAEKSKFIEDEDLFTHMYYSVIGPSNDPSGEINIDLHTYGENNGRIDELFNAYKNVYAEYLVLNDDGTAYNFNHGDSYDTKLQLWSEDGSALWNGKIIDRKDGHFVVLRVFGNKRYDIDEVPELNISEEKVDLKDFLQRAKDIGFITESEFDELYYN